METDESEIERAIDSLEDCVSKAGLVKPEDIRANPGGFVPDQMKHISELKKSVCYACTFLYGMPSATLGRFYNLSHWTIRAKSLEVANNPDWANRVRQGILWWCKGAKSNMGRFGKVAKIVRKKRCKT